MNASIAKVDAARNAITAGDLATADTLLKDAIADSGLKTRPPITGPSGSTRNWQTHAHTVRSATPNRCRPFTPHRK